MTKPKKPSNKASHPATPPTSGSESHVAKAASDKELSEEQLEQVAGGANLAQACATGKHIAKVIITT
jgi:hypothetical protein